MIQYGTGFNESQARNSAMGKISAISSKNSIKAVISFTDVPVKIIFKNWKVDNTFTEVLIENNTN